ncbi:MAG TPA: hypothetical protein VGP64_17850 [Polyangia bacterium]|jgi:hypothetical protein
MTPAPPARPSRSAASLPIAALLVTVAAPACHRDIHLLPLADADGGARTGVGGAGVGGAAGIGGAAGDSGVAAADGGGITCAGGLGPPIMLPTATGMVCASTLEQRGHLFGLCTCQDLILGSQLRTDAFDSTDPHFNDDQMSSAVGIDGALSIDANGPNLRAGGAVYVAGTAGVYAAGSLEAGASFRSNGPLTMLSANASFQSDAFVNGLISGQVQIDGTLRVPQTADVGPQVQANSVVTEAVSVSAPCDCNGGFVDLLGAINTAAGSNNDTAAGLDPNSFGKVLISRTLDLSCGTYYLSSLQASAPVTLAVHGRALLVVQGDVNVQGGDLAVSLDAGAELDLVVGGWLLVSGGGTIGAPAAPARFRMWVAGTDAQSVVFNGQPTIAAVIHAPTTTVSATNGLTISGSLLTQSLFLGGTSQSYVHYDRAILKAGAACGEMPASVIP